MKTKESTDKIVEIKELAVYRFDQALRAINHKQPLLGHNRQFGFNTVVTDVSIEIGQARYGKIDHFDYAVLGMHDGYNIIVYRQEGSAAHGIGVQNEDVFLEITIFDLVEWMAPKDKYDRHMMDRLALLNETLIEVEKLAA